MMQPLRDNSETDSPIGQHGIETAILVDKIRLLHKNIPGGIIGNILAGIPLAGVMWLSGYRVSVLVWLGFHLSLLLLRSLHYRTFSNASSTRAALRYGRRNIWLLAMTGASWGLAGILFFDPQLIESNTFLILTLVCIMSGSINATSSTPPAFYLFALFTVSPILLLVLFQATPFYLLMGISGAAYLAMNLLFSRNLHDSITENLRLKYQNLDLVEDLRVQTAAAQQANLEKSRFLAAASHDIRQPLHAANLFADAMRVEVDTENQRYILSGIRRGLDSVSELFDALLDVSSIDTRATPVDKSSFKLSDLVSSLLDSFEIEAQKKGLGLRFYDCDHWVYTDRILLERILSNLITNSINYTEQGEITIYCAMLNEDYVSLHIKDTGIGIESEHQESIFLEFVQLDNPERDRSKGLGLGLAIVRRLTELLELPLGLTSARGKGTEFTLKLPIGEPSEGLQPLVPGAHASNALRGLAVLIVDNEIDIVTGLTMVLEKWGCDVSSSSSSEDVLARISRSRPDVVISDFRMPGELDGIDLLTAIRSIDPGIKGLIVSGDTGKDVINKSQEHDITLLKKPIKPVQLHMAISQMLSP